jgi:predicted DNA-binding transcriptional regulator AlpA
MNLALVQKPAVLLQLGCGNTQLYREISARLMTPGISQGRRKVVWPAYEIETICKAKISGMSADERRALVEQLIEQRKQMRPQLTSRQECQAA